MSKPTPSRPGNRHISNHETGLISTAISLTSRMRRRTSALHDAAERSGVISALLAGRATRPRYALYLRNLLPAYQAMERVLRHHPSRPDLAGLAQPSIYRSASIIADLVYLTGSGWASALPLLPAAERYAARVTSAGGDALLIAHCYTRYLGDLSGGQLLGRCLIKQFGPDFRALAFNRFPDIPDLNAFRATYRQALDQAGTRLAEVEAVIEEAAVAFQLNTRISLEVDKLDDIEAPGRALHQQRLAVSGTGVGDERHHATGNSSDTRCKPCYDTSLTD